MRKGPRNRNWTSTGSGDNSSTNNNPNKPDNHNLKNTAEGAVRLKTIVAVVVSAVVQSSASRPRVSLSSRRVALPMAVRH